MQEGIVIFLEIKEANVEFRELMADVEFKCDFAFLVDILSKLNDLNVTLQGKDVFAHEMYNAVKSFSVTLNLLSQQVKQGNLSTLCVDQRPASG